MKYISKYWRKSMDTETNKILEEYESIFHELPKIPIMSSYEPIADLMREAIIRKSPLTIEETAEVYQDLPCDQGDARLSELK